MQNINQTSAEALIDFSGGDKNLDSLALLQMQGAVALHNMLARQNMAYLADEVGMGKTYIALGVVALMRHFKPELRVLYLLPQHNVRDKWDRDYRSFINKNFILQDLRVKGLNDRPAATSVISENLKALIASVATDSVRDFFICSSAFSFSLGNSAAQLIDSLHEFCVALPQKQAQAEPLLAEIQQAGDVKGLELDSFKLRVKQCWASALNAILPCFDLLIVDEAHNFKGDMESSYRNQLLAAMLGTDDKNPARRKAERLLLLSATPFDRDIEQLRNQLILFGKEELLPVTNRSSQEAKEVALGNFMVRRLNAIQLEGSRHTRNMYREEHRSGPRAQVSLKLEQQLFAALLQKKVSESLQENCSGRFELGMLSSFETYLPGEKGKPIEFDGDREAADKTDGNKRDARDRNIVQYLIDDYFQHFSGQTPPHPKMDAVALEAHRCAFDLGKKQLIFVRRVLSVPELKHKIERAYDAWLGNYIAADSGVSYWFDHYQKMERKLEYALEDIEAEDGTAATSPLSFFAWFYRGANDALEAADTKARPNNPAALGTVPKNFSNMLNSRSMMFETNWASLPGMPPAETLKINWAHSVTHKVTGGANRQQRFKQAQFAYLHAVKNEGDTPAAKVAQRILDVAFEGYTASCKLPNFDVLARDLPLPTLWNCLDEHNALAGLQPGWNTALFNGIAADDNKAARQLVKRLLIHHELVAVVCRGDHPFIDLYSLRSKFKESEEGTADQALMNAFAALLLQQQSAHSGFCSFQILRDLTDTLDLLLKQNFQEAYGKAANELTQYLSNQLNPLAPVVGATGENNKNRSAIARKFRMPGYPRVLISTDVFQEGEDLHTFCDQVIHYGISASPIALEQKIGRVDRIASLAHRALQANAHAPKEHFIQVNFPHIKESLEFFQVRQAAANLNQFHRSLHKIGNAETASAEVDIARHLRDASQIEDQIREQLFSPFEVTAEDLKGADRIEQIEATKMAVAARLSHASEAVQVCFSRELNCAVTLSETKNGLTWHSDTEDEIKLGLHCAHGYGELLFSVSQTQESQFELRTLTDGDCLDELQKLQSNPHARLQFFGDPKQDIGTLVRNAQVYAGGLGVLAESEILDTYRRVCSPDSQANIATTLARHPAQELKAMVAALCGQHDTHHGYQLKRAGRGGLEYTFAGIERVQYVQWCQAGNYVLISSRVLDAIQTGNLTAKLLITSTLRRNTQFELVDFYINDANELAVRAMHPLLDLDQPELAFMAFAVATEANRLQYILLNAVNDGGDDGDGAADDAGDDCANAGDSARVELAPCAQPTSERASLLALDNAMCAIRRRLQNGPMMQRDVIRQIAYSLNYQRASQNISGILARNMRAAARRRIIETINGEVRLFAQAISEYDTVFLQDQFLAALSAYSQGYIDRDYAIRLFARWMGFYRTGPIIDSTARTIIDALLDEGRLEAQAANIRRTRSAKSI